MICKINIVVCQTDQNKEMPGVFLDPKSNGQMSISYTLTGSKAWKALKSSSADSSRLKG